ncbi:MAG: DUF2249 domain-containing protein [Gammaproteobacteria bacterium]|nr:DUF2249 domain-containing protein [Gammaproteobacteria bacterium]NIR84870.1 DUF2249 domain-containing protein [Gammaproteobacteria bacterium]NIR91719.1 DUF2249 domain-containing protein [Gammaproteobacteria bacterium]NIU05917.1 DUF2249 domain-containing protein [Gammaproteobacteria bacterium]NIV52964.1 DUF2249 domain-containing protein [Gammaproteobacteria bacterium]
MTRERVLDVSELPPPEPLEQALSAVESLCPGEYLRMLHRREPWLLFPELDTRGFRYHMQPGTRSAFDIFIWRDGDTEAEGAVARIIAEPDDGSA